MNSNREISLTTGKKKKTPEHMDHDISQHRRHKLLSYDLQLSYQIAFPQKQCSWGKACCNKIN